MALKSGFKHEVPLSSLASLEQSIIKKEMGVEPKISKVQSWTSIALKELIPRDPYVTKEYTGFVPDSSGSYGSSCAKISSQLISRQAAGHPNAKRLFPDIKDYSKSLSVKAPYKAIIYIDQFLSEIHRVNGCYKAKGPTKTGVFLADFPKGKSAIERNYPLPEEMEYLTLKAKAEVPLPKYQGYMPGSKYYIGERQAAVQAHCLVKLKKDIENYNKTKEELQLYFDSLESMAPVQRLKNTEKPVPLERKRTYDPYFSGPSDPQKFFTQGYQGHIPFYKNYAGLPNRIAMQYGLMNFYNKHTKNKKMRMATTRYAESLEANVLTPMPPSGGQLVPPQYPDIFNEEEQRQFDPIRLQELDKLVALTGYKKHSSKAS